MKITKYNALLIFKKYEKKCQIIDFVTENKQIVKKQKPLTPKK